MCRFELGIGGDVGVSVQREPRRVVAEHTADGFDVHPVLECQGRERMAQIMKAYPWQSRPFQHPLEHVQHAVR